MFPMGLVERGRMKKEGLVHDLQSVSETAFEGRRQIIIRRSITFSRNEWGGGKGRGREGRRKGS